MLKGAARVRIVNGQVYHLPFGSPDPDDNRGKCCSCIRCCSCDCSEGPFKWEGIMFTLLCIFTILMGIILYVTVRSKVATIFFGLSVWMVSLCVHEWAHAIVAYNGGDRSVVEKGYLTLNPLKYTEIIGSFIIPLCVLLLGGLGLPGGAVYIDKNSLTKWWETFVSLAGPCGNLAMALLTSIPFWFIPKNSPIYLGEHAFFWQGLAFCVFIQFTSVFFNLIPIPPLDGFGAILPHLPEHVREWVEDPFHYFCLSMGGTVLVFALFMTIPGLTSFLVSFTTIFGVPYNVIVAGVQNFKLL